MRDGNEVKETIPYEYEYFVENPNGSHQDVHGNRFKKMVAKNRKEMMSVKDSGMLCCETDLNEVTKFLQKRYEGMELEVDIDNFNIAYIDIETTGKSKPEEPNDAINLITVISSKTGKEYTFGTSEFTKKDSEYVKNYCYCPDELRMLTQFVKWFRKSKFDIITGWNSMTFDIPYIINRIRKLTDSGLEYKLSPISKIIEKKKEKFNQQCVVFDIVGLVHLDYMDLYDSFTFVNLPSLSLNYVTNYELGEGKLEYEGQLNDLWKTDWNLFAEYNVQDTRLLKKLEAKLKFIELAITLGYESLIPFDKFGSKVALIEGYILRDHRKKGLVMQDRTKLEKDWWWEGRHYIVKEKNFLTNEVETVYQNCKIDDGEKTFEPFKVKGGFVKANRGYYENNMSFDITSEYPHMIILYNISPETKVILPTEEQIAEDKLIKSVINGVYYRSDIEGFLPTIVRRIFNERADFKNKMFEYKNNGDYEKAQYYNNQQQIRKIMINSMYGVLANSGFHYFDPDNARAITRGGRTMIRYLSGTVDKYFVDNWHKIYRKYFPEAPSQIEPLKNKLVCLIDTDSNYLCLDEIKQKTAPDMEFIDFANIMENEVLQPFFDKVLNIYAKKLDRPQCIVFKREGIITQQFILAKKKYITRLLVNEKEVFEKPKLKFTGVEVVRSDTPVYCQTEITNAVESILDNMDKDFTIKLLRKNKKAFKSQSIAEIAYSTGIKEYTKYAQPTEYYLQNGLSYVSRTTIHARGAMCYNYMVGKHKLPYMEIENGSKMKYIYVIPNNVLKTYVIGFVGHYPKEFENHFEIDYDTQFEKAFLSTIQRMFDVLNWGKINLRGSKMSRFAKKKTRAS